MRFFKNQKRKASIKRHPSSQPKSNLVEQVYFNTSNPKSYVVNTTFRTRSYE